MIVRFNHSIKYKGIFYDAFVPVDVDDNHVIIDSITEEVTIDDSNKQEYYNQDAKSLKKRGRPPKR